MEKVVFEEVEVDRCTGCQGIWFDFQEQKHEVIKRRDDRHRDQAAGKKWRKHIRCPKCGTLLTHLVDVEQAHIAYEACPHDYGVFFDAGEFTDYSQKTLLESLRKC
jgi:Zn-finger nucleic acid-binding protein